MDNSKEEYPSLSISLVYLLLTILGLVSGMYSYRVFDIPNSKAWPVALGGVLSIVLPVAFGLFRKHSLSMAILELVASSSKLGSGGIKSNKVALVLWGLMVMTAVAYALYQEI